MTSVAIVVFGADSLELPVPTLAALNSRVCESGCVRLRQERAFAYTLLERAYADFFEKKLPAISFSPDGKPYLVESKIKVSVSHSDGICAVSFSDLDNGIDVQGYDSMLGKERAVERFVNKDVQKMIKNAKKPDLRLSVYRANERGELETVDEGEVVLCARPSAVGVDAAMLWPSAEALLKCRNGFRDIAMLSQLAAASRVYTFYTHGAAVSVAELIG